MDPLAQVIQLVRPSGLLWKEMVALGDWAVRFPANPGVVFSFVSLGVCVFRRGGETPIELREGDFLVMRSPPHWTLGLNENSAPVDYVTGRKPSDARLVRLGDGTQPKTCVLGGRFVFEPTNTTLVEHLVPPLLIVRDLDTGAGRLRKVLDLLRDEALDALPGREFAIARLLELLLVETIRNSGRSATAGMERGFLCGLADEHVARVLVAMHADIAHRWTAVELARVAGMSRSMFAERFSRIVGVPPMGYLVRWRIAIAKDMLRRNTERLAEIGERTGYGSVSAFSTAFTRIVGCSPSAYQSETDRLT